MPHRHWWHLFVGCLCQLTKCRVHLPKVHVHQRRVRDKWRVLQHEPSSHRSPHHESTDCTHGSTHHGSTDFA